MYLQFCIVEFVITIIIINHNANGCFKWLADTHMSTVKACNQLIDYSLHDEGMVVCSRSSVVACPPA